MGWNITWAMDEPEVETLSTAKPLCTGSAAGLEGAIEVRSISWTIQLEHVENYAIGRSTTSLHASFAPLKPLICKNKITQIPYYQYTESYESSPVYQAIALFSHIRGLRGVKEAWRLAVDRPIV